MRFWYLLSKKIFHFRKFVYAKICRNRYSHKNLCGNKSTQEVIGMFWGHFNHQLDLDFNSNFLFTLRQFHTMKLLFLCFLSGLDNVQEKTPPPLSGQSPLTHTNSVFGRSLTSETCLLCGSVIIFCFVYYVACFEFTID